MRRRSDEQPVSDINITPLTDVMLVLLVIFMISSPILLSRGMEIHLPQVDDPPVLIEEDHVLYVSTDGVISLDGQEYTLSNLGARFSELVTVADESGDSVNLFIRGDETVTYGEITAIMDLATSSGIERISLVQDVLTVNGDSVDPE